MLMGIGFRVVCRILAVLDWFFFGGGVEQELGKPERKGLVFLEPTGIEQA